MNAHEHYADTSQEYDGTAANYFFSAVFIILAGSGVIMNFRFLVRNRGFTKWRKEKLTDIKLMAMILSLFNILFLFDVIPKLYYIYGVDIPKENYVGCMLYQYYIHFSKFGVFYMVLAITRDCYLLSLNTQESNKSNRCQILIEVLCVWSIYIGVVLGLDFGVGLRNKLEHCIKSYLDIYGEPVILVFMLTALLFVFLAHLQYKRLTENDTTITLVVLKCKKMCFYYFGCWFPYFIFNLFEDHQITVGLPVHVIHILKLVLRTFDLLSPFAFPFIFNIKKFSDIQDQEI